MIHLILSVPNGFNAETFCNVATAMIRDSQNEYDRRDYDYDLGEFVKPHYVAGDMVYSLGNNEYLQPISALIENAKKPAPLYRQYEVNADFVDMAHIEALQKLQTICPQVEIHFENCGDGKNETTAYDEYFAENYIELLRHHA